MVFEAPEVEQVAIIGGSGFIGRRLEARLRSAGRQVRVLDVNEPPDAAVEWVPSDVRDPHALTSALRDASTAYNLAAARGTEVLAWDEYRELNVEGARNVCAAATSAGVRRIVFTSSAAVYGRVDGPDEHSTPRPVGDYGRSKLMAEDIYAEWCRCHRTRCLVVVRPTVVFGPGDTGAGDRLLRVAAGPDFVHFGPRGRRKSLAFVENLAAFLAFVGQCPPGLHVYNYCDLPDMAMEDIVHTVRTALGLAPARSGSRVRAFAAALGMSLRTRLDKGVGPGLRTRLRAASERRFDASRAHAIGFTQPVRLRTALAETVRTDLAWLALLQRHSR